MKCAIYGKGNIMSDFNDNDWFLNIRKDWLQNTQLKAIYPDLWQLFNECDIPNDIDLVNGKKTTTFPDFISNLGFIEIFHITSGTYKKKNGKGGMNNLIVEKFNEQKHTDVNRQLIVETVIERNTLNNSENNLITSIRRHLEEHIQSLNQYNGIKHISCFLMISDDCLVTQVAVSQNYNGDYCFIDEIKKIKKYRIWLDIDLLHYIEHYSEQIDFLLYYNSNTEDLQILKVSEISTIMDRFHNNPDIQYTHYSPITTNYHTSIQIGNTNN